MVLQAVTHDPIAHAVAGFVGESIDNPDINAMGVLTFGFLWGTGTWSLCETDPVNTYSDCESDPVNTWTVSSIYD